MGRPARAIKHLLSAPSLTVDEFIIDASRGRLEKNGHLAVTTAALPGPMSSKPVQWWRLARHLPKSGYDLWHLTNQSLAFINRQPAVITVYDLIELMSPQQRLAGPAFRYLYHGISRAAHLICISDYTKRTVQDVYGIADDRISVIPLAVGPHFTRLAGAKQTVAYRTFLTEQTLTPRHKIILYVGSEHPRKNLSTLVAAFAGVRRRHPDAVLIKVGEPGIAAGREKFLADLDRHGVRRHVRLLHSLGDEDLQFIYSIADVFVFPSTFEGFGLPPLEAMACGCPVVASNATSLPEVVGAAGLLCPPESAEAFTASISRVLEESDVARRLAERGPRRAALFTWERAAAGTLAVYQRVLGASRK
jgi:glycosyltransferase involved in cell wall biosynthesis